MVNREDRRILIHSWGELQASARPFIDLFFDNLFEEDPRIAGLFPSNLESHKKKILETLDQMITSISWDEDSWGEETKDAKDIFLLVLDLGKRHYGYHGMKDAHIYTFRHAMSVTLRAFFEEPVALDTVRVWDRFLVAIFNTMKIAKTSRMDTGLPDGTRRTQP